MSTDDLRSAVRVRMAELQLDQRALARLVAEAWGVKKWQSAERRLSGWMTGRQDMTTEPFAALLGVLGLTIGVSVDGATK